MIKALSQQDKKHIKYIKLRNMCVYNGDKQQYDVQSIRLIQF